MFLSLNLNIEGGFSWTNNDNYLSVFDSLEDAQKIIDQLNCKRKIIADIIPFNWLIIKDNIIVDY
jgi:hypothetical protein